MADLIHPDIPGLVYQQDLGSGGFADVYLYRRLSPDRPVALKVLRSTDMSDILVRRFTAEANAMAALSHPHIAQVYSAGVAPDGRPYIEMAYYPNGSLEDRVHQAPLDVPDVLRIGVQLCSAIETAHQLNPPLLHRDIKPANVLIDEYGDPALTDFGIASRLNDQEDEDASLSVYWASPETMFGTSPIDKRSDVYSLGAMLWHLLVGHAPYIIPGGDNRPSPTMIRTRDLPLPAMGRPDVPITLQRLLASTMGKDPSVRPATAADLARALNAIEQNQYGFARVTPFKIRISQVPHAAQPAIQFVDYEQTRLKSTLDLDIQPVLSDSGAPSSVFIKPVLDDAQQPGANSLPLAKPSNDNATPEPHIVSGTGPQIAHTADPLAFPVFNPQPVPTAVLANPMAVPQVPPPASVPVVARPSRKLKFIISMCVAVAVVVAAIAIGAYFYVIGPDDPTKPVVAGEAATPQAAVRGYLQALAAGNSHDAMSFLDVADFDSTFMTDSVLTASNAANPITNIVTTKDPGSARRSATVTANYQIGQQTVSADFAVALVGQYYLLESGFQAVDLSHIYAPGVGMALNGALIDTKTSSSSIVNLLPGTYQLTVTNSLLTVSHGQFIVTDPHSTTSLFDTVVTLSSDAPSKLAAAAKSTLDGCMAEQEILTSCNFGYSGLSANDQPIQSSIKWSFTQGNSDFSTTTFQYNPAANPAQADASVGIRVRVVAENTAQQSYFGDQKITSVHIDFSNPNDLIVSFDSSDV